MWSSASWLLSLGCGGLSKEVVLYPTLEDLRSVVNHTDAKTPSSEILI